MYISLNWIKDFVDLDGVNVDELVNKFTLSCAEVEGVIHKGEDISGIVTARIESVENHPNSKKLHLLKVNTGKEIIDVVCGAPNVRVGLITAFATLGAKVGEITISKTAIAGYESSGMYINKDNGNSIMMAHCQSADKNLRQICSKSVWI